MFSSNTYITVRSPRFAAETANCVETVDFPVPGVGVAVARERIRAVVQPLDGDREPGPDLAALTLLVHDGAFVDLVASAASTPGGGSTALHSTDR